MYEILQVISILAFDRIPLIKTFANEKYQGVKEQFYNQLKIFYLQRDACELKSIKLDLLSIEIGNFIEPFNYFIISVFNTLSDQRIIK